MLWCGVSQSANRVQRRGQGKDTLREVAAVNQMVGETLREHRPQRVLVEHLCPDAFVGVTMTHT